MLRETILEMEFCDTTADHDVYRRKTMKPNGEVYYEIIRDYVDGRFTCCFAQGKRNNG